MSKKVDPLVRVQQMRADWALEKSANEPVTDEDLMNAVANGEDLVSRGNNGAALKWRGESYAPGQVVPNAVLPRSGNRVRTAYFNLQSKVDEAQQRKKLAQFLSEDCRPLEQLALREQNEIDRQEKIRVDLLAQLDAVDVAIGDARSRLAKHKAELDAVLDGQPV